ncbi:OmpA family protein [Cellulophaga baltica]|uniref:OmpA family protein n=1 Tax=Cellulophaga baltica TaxID=76594 RepID=UPI00040E8C4E|nr:OmpA family protein [Cellulophaga baltica]AIY15082.1 flagellar motor protein MotB [Cellulophaga baltica NN016038]
MKFKLTHIVLCTAFVSFGLQAQEKQAVKAQSKFNSFDYADAISSYEDLIKEGYSSEDVYKNLGDANYMNAQYKEASTWYQKLFELENTTIDPEYLYRYAQTLKSLKEYDASDAWMEKFEQAKATDGRAEKFNNEKDYLTAIKENSGRYSIKNLPINSKESDFSPAFYENELIFSSARDSGTVTKTIHLWNRKSFLNLYKTAVTEDDNFTTPTKLSKTVNKKAHESSPVFTKDGQTMYFTRNNFKNGSFSRDEEGVSRLKLYKATLQNGAWADITALPFNGEDYSTAHPALNTYETKLYFASDRPGTLGASDIFYVTINSDGSYGSPVNLGASVNTESRETFPNISDTDILYFASDGHPGLGGLDVFGIDLAELERTKAKNLGQPLNSEQDDFSYIINDTTKKGYFASNRENGIGSDDIYGFSESKALDFNCYSNLKGIVKDEKTKEIIADAVLNITNANGEVIGKGISDSEGNFDLDSSCEKGAYTIITLKENYAEATTAIEIGTSLEINDIEILLISNFAPADLGADLAKKLNLEKIYFDFDQSYIRKDAQIIMEKVIAYLNQYPDTKIRIGSHTDARANDAYNSRLSERRAKATYDYLVKKGIDASRLTFKGFGETQLTNECENTVNCSAEKHQQNRRSEFIVVE